MTAQLYRKLERLASRALLTWEVSHAISLAPCRMCRAVEGEVCMDNRTRDEPHATIRGVIHSDRLNLYRRAMEYQREQGLGFYRE